MDPVTFRTSLVAGLGSIENSLEPKCHQQELFYKSVKGSAVLPMSTCLNVSAAHYNNTSSHDSFINHSVSGNMNMK